jgi:hypothetical protein
VGTIGTTLPTPLHPLFEQRYSFGELMVNVIFALYAFGVITGLLVFARACPVPGMETRLQAPFPLERGKKTRRRPGHVPGPIWCLA